MKKSIAMILMVKGIAVAATTAVAAEPVYIPWTFDDFDSNCAVINAVQPVELSAVAVEIADDTEAGELGW